MSAYQPKTGERCHCSPGDHRDNCPDCEGTGWRIDFAAIRALRADKPFICGTRSVKRKGPSDYRVVCATCGAGGTVAHRERAQATAAAVRDSCMPCSACGAK